MTVQRKRFPNSVVYLVALTLTATSGCAQLYHAVHYNWLSSTIHEYRRPYFHSPHTGRIIAKKPGHYDNVSEPACYGYEPTCWHAWTPECASCPPPDQILSEEEVTAEPVESQAPEEAPEQTPGGFEGILNLDDPLPGERPLIRDPQDGAGAESPEDGSGVADPIEPQESRLAPRPKANITPVSLPPRGSARRSFREAINARESIEPTSISVWDTHSMRPDPSASGESVTAPIGVDASVRSREPITFAEQPPRVEQTEERVEISMVTGDPAPPAPAPKVEKPDGGDQPSRRSSRRPIRFTGQARTSSEFPAPTAFESSASKDAVEVAEVTKPATPDQILASANVMASASPVDVTPASEQRPIPSFKIVPARATQAGKTGPARVTTRIQFVSGEGSPVSNAVTNAKPARDSSLRFR